MAHIEGTLTEDEIQGLFRGDRGLAQGLDVHVKAWNERPLDQTTYPFLLADAMHLRVRRQGAVRATTALIVVGVNAEGFREILGIRIANWKTEQGWLETFR